MNEKSNPLVSVVNVTWNGKEFLKKHLPSLKNLKYPNYEVIIVDNASTDGSIEFVRENYPEFKIIQNKTNLGTAQGSNVAIAQAKGEYIFWVSNDMEFDPYTLNHLIARCQSDETIGICTVKMLRIKDEELVDEIDSVGADIDIFGFPFSRGINEQDRGQYDQAADVFFSFGGAMLIRKSLLSIIGGYDPDYLTLADDIDLSWRAHLAGFRVVVEPKAFLYHRVSATLGKTHNRAQKRYISERNTLRTLLKNYSQGYLFLILPSYLTILLLETMFFLLVGKIKIATSGPKTLLWNLFHYKETLALRKKVQAFRKVKDSAIVAKMLKRIEKIRLFFDFIIHSRADRWINYF
ncbi:MAG: glycosyltransferase family 2 protein [Candidatus Omnitrophota bacterium]